MATLPREINELKRRLAALEGADVIVVTSTPAGGGTGGGGSSGGLDGHTIVDETTPLTQRPNLVLQGAGVTATDDGVSNTIVTIPGGVSATGTPSINTYLRGDSSWATDVPAAFNTQAGSYTLVLTDAGKIINMTAGGTVTIGTAVATLPAGSEIIIRSGSSSVATTVAATAPATVASRDNVFQLAGQYSYAGLLKTGASGTNSWELTGDLLSSATAGGASRAWGFFNG